ncbi:MAG: hypothetical protein L3J47_00620 [Sulfurovum sp.]|nr:hypothetical protein [Sulfurovum sp.]
MALRAIVLLSWVLLLVAVGAVTAIAVVAQYGTVTSLLFASSTILAVAALAGCVYVFDHLWDQNPSYTVGRNKRNKVAKVVAINE